MSADHSAGERLGVGMIWGRDCGGGGKRVEEGSERVGICTGGLVAGWGTSMMVGSWSEPSGREGIGTEAMGTGDSSSSEDKGSRWAGSSRRDCFSELTCLLREFILLVRITMCWERSMVALGVVATRGGSVGWGRLSSAPEMGLAWVAQSHPQGQGMLKKGIWW